MFTNNFVEKKTDRRVSFILRSMNTTAEYMAIYGMQNMTQFVKTPGVFGNLQHYLNRDMGLALPMEIAPNYGMGDIIDLTPPQSPTSEPDEEHIMMDADDVMTQEMGTVINQSQAEVETHHEAVIAKSKGKEKALPNQSFEDGGFHTFQELDNLSRDNLMAYLKEFETIMIDLKKEIMPGIHVRDIYVCSCHAGYSKALHGKGNHQQKFNDQLYRKR